jgi:hypothetical protein
VKSISSPFHFPRNREPWTPDEERKLLKIYASTGRVWWCGSWRSAPRYRAAEELGRSPSAVQDRFTELQRCRQRARVTPTQDTHDNIDEDGSPLNADNDPDA